MHTSSQKRTVHTLHGLFEFHWAKNGTRTHQSVAAVNRTVQPSASCPAPKLCPNSCMVTRKRMSGGIGAPLLMLVVNPGKQKSIKHVRFYFIYLRDGLCPKDHILVVCSLSIPMVAVWISFPLLQESKNHKKKNRPEHWNVDGVDHRIFLHVISMMTRSLDKT